jgi:N-glycosylase/DNA lyase
MVSTQVIEELRSEYSRRKDEIRAQLGEFKKVREHGDDRKIFEELAFCILTSAVGPRVGMKSLDAIRDILPDGTAEETESRLKGIHKYPEKAYYIAHTRDYLETEYGFKLRDLVNSFDDEEERRDFFALNKNIKGLGFTQSSHFLRNIGFTGYAILDKNVVRSLYSLGVIDSPEPPSTKKKYMEIEGSMKALADELEIEIDELDMLLWSMKTGRIPV